MKRTFIAVKVEPEESFLNLISSLRSGLQNDSVKWTNTSQIHITLVFLGNTKEEDISPVIEMLRNKCMDTGKFELVMRGAGVFKSFTDPRIIWTGIEDSEKLSDLNRKISDGLNELKIKIEDRPFKPHLTIARIKHISDTDALKKMISGFPDRLIQKIPVSEVIFFESILLPAGPVYKPIAQIEL